MSQLTVYTDQVILVRKTYKNFLSTWRNNYWNVTQCYSISFITYILLKVVLTAAEKGMNGAVAKAVSIASNMEGGNAYILGQFDNPTNPKAHRYSIEISYVGST